MQLYLIRDCIPACIQLNIKIRSGTFPFCTRNFLRDRRDQKESLSAKGFFPRENPEIRIRGPPQNEPILRKALRFFSMIIGIEIESTAMKAAFLCAVLLKLALF